MLGKMTSSGARPITLGSSVAGPRVPLPRVIGIHVWKGRYDSEGVSEDLVDCSWPTRESIVDCGESTTVGWAYDRDGHLLSLYGRGYWYCWDCRGSCRLLGDCMLYFWRDTIDHDDDVSSWDNDMCYVLVSIFWFTKYWNPDGLSFRKQKTLFWDDVMFCTWTISNMEFNPKLYNKHSPSDKRSFIDFKFICITVMQSMILKTYNVWKMMMY